MSNPWSCKNLDNTWLVVGWSNFVSWSWFQMFLSFILNHCYCLAPFNQVWELDEQNYCTYTIILMDYLLKYISILYCTTTILKAIDLFDNYSLQKHDSLSLFAWYIGHHLVSPRVTQSIATVHGNLKKIKFW